MVKMLLEAPASSLAACRGFVVARALWAAPW